MKNDLNWKYANKVMATFSIVIGLLTFLGGSVLWLMDETENQVVVFAALIALLISIAIVELKLYRFEHKDRLNN